MPDLNGSLISGPEIEPDIELVQVARMLFVCAQAAH